MSDDYKKSSITGPTKLDGASWINAKMEGVQNITGATLPGEEEITGKRSSILESLLQKVYNLFGKKNIAVAETKERVEMVAKDKEEIIEQNILESANKVPDVHSSKAQQHKNKEGLPTERLR